MRRRPFRRSWDARSTGAAIALFASVVLLGWTTSEMARLDPPPGPEAADEDSDPAPAPVFGVIEAESIEPTVQSNPFSPSRSAPQTRFTLAGMDAGRPEDVDEQMSFESGPPPTLMGVARAGGRAFALVELAGEASRLLRPGQRIGDWTLESVRDGVAAFVSDGGERVELSMAATR